MSWSIVELERMVANMMRYGVIDAVDEANARVTVKIGSFSTDWIPWLTGRAGGDRDWWMPEVGEQVLVLSPFGDYAQAVALPSIYQNNHPAPAASKDIRKIEFADGAIVEYDRANHVFTVTTSGTVNVSATNVNISASSTHNGNISVNGNVAINGNLSTSGNASVSGAMSATGGIYGNNGLSFEGHTHTDSRGGGTSTPH